MIDDELFPSMNEPIKMRLRNGLFYGDLDGMGEIVALTLEGRFAGLGKCLFKGFPYFYLALNDETNTIQILFQPKSANLKDIVLSMAGERFEYVFMEAYAVEKKRSRIRLYLDKERMFPHYDERLPPIRRVRDGKGKPYYCLYGDRLKKIAEIIDLINKGNNIQPALLGCTLPNLGIFL